MSNQLVDDKVLDALKYDDNGLIPAIVQDACDGQVLMLAYMNQESLALTLATGKASYFSRSRQQLWVKGETSGNCQLVKRISYDCDQDTLLLQVEQLGPACHTGEKSCFHRQLLGSDGVEQAGLPASSRTIGELYQLLLERKATAPRGSYVASLYEAGIDRILKKVGEEASEVIIAGKNLDQDELIYETADLAFHTLLLLAYLNVRPEQVLAELASRRK